MSSDVRGEQDLDDGLAPWVAAARDGDAAAFDELVRRTYVDTYTLAVRLIGDEEDARDVVQEAYLRAFRGLQRFRGDARFTTWMYRITANCASTLLGRRRRSRHEELTDDLPAADEHPGVDPEARADQAALRDRLQDALRGLPPKLRAVVVLRDIYDLPHEAIADELGISESAAKVRLHRARRKLRDQLVTRAPVGEADAGPPDEQGATPMPMRCEDLDGRLAGAADGSLDLDGAARRHVEQCLRCQAELVQYRKVLRALRSLRTDRLEPAPGLLPEILATIEEAGERRALRSLVSGRRVAYLGGLAAATAAGAAGAIVLGSRNRRRFPVAG